MRILLAEDHHAVRRQIRQLLESHADWFVVAEVTNGRDAVEQAKKLRPDVAILDVTMPEADGFQASRQIARCAPFTRILLLTAHHVSSLAKEAGRIGIRGIVSKAEADEKLIAAIDALGNGNDVHLAGSVVSSRHIGAFFISSAERYRVLGPFIEEGLEAGQKALHIINPPEERSHLNGLRDVGVDVDRALSQHQLELASWASFYLPHARFDKEATLLRLRQLVEEASSAGRFPITRLVAHMEWAVQSPPAAMNELIEYESRVNGMLPAFADVVVCAYDTGKFDGAVIVDAFRAHPAVIIGGSLHENPFYISTDRMIEEMRSRDAH